MRSIKSITIDIELILLGFATENRVVVQDQATPSSTVFLVNLKGPGGTGEAPADPDHVEYSTGILSCPLQCRPMAVTNQVRGLSNRSRVAIGVGIVADTAITGPGIAENTL